MSRHTIKQTTTNRRVYKCMHQDLVFYYESEFRWRYKEPVHNWKYYRANQYYKPAKKHAKYFKNN